MLDPCGHEQQVACFEHEDASAPNNDVDLVLGVWGITCQPSSDDKTRAYENGVWYLNSEGPHCSEIDRKVKLCRLLNRVSSK